MATVSYKRRVMPRSGGFDHRGTYHSDYALGHQHGEMRANADLPPPVGCSKPYREGYEKGQRSQLLARQARQMGELIESLEAKHKRDLTPHERQVLARHASKLAPI